MRNDGACVSGDFVAESELGPTVIAMRSDCVSVADGAIRIDLRGLDKEWFIGHRVGKLIINDATFVLEEKE